MPITNGNYIIRSALDENLVLLATAGSKSKGAKITVGAFTETDNRCYWKSSVISTNYNKFSNLNTGASNGNITASSVEDTKGITQNAYKIGTSAWYAELVYSEFIGDAFESGVIYYERSEGDLGYVYTPTEDVTYVSTKTYYTRNKMTVNGVSVEVYSLKPYVNRNLYVTAPDNGGDLYLTSLLTDNPARQSFYFEPTTYYNKSLSTPKSLTATDDKEYIINTGSTTFKPRWKNTNTGIIYEQRYRSRVYDTEGNLASDWGYWTGWNQISAVATLNDKKKYTGIMEGQAAISTPSVDNITYTKAEIQVQIRITSAKDVSAYNSGFTNNVTHGPTLSGTITQWCVPSLNISAAIYSPDGLALTYATNYTVAGSSIIINSIKGPNNVILIENYTFTGQNYQGDLYLNCEELHAIPNNNDTLAITATIVEENGVVANLITTSLTCAYATSGGLAISPVYSLTDRLTLQATITKYDVTQCFIEHTQLDGSSLWVACDVVEETNNSIKFEIPVPFGRAPSLLWVCVDSNSHWTSSIVSPPNMVVYTNYYTWYWVDQDSKPHTVILKYNAGKIMSPKDSIELSGTEFVTTGREYPVFRYGKSVKRELDISGVILNDETDTYCTRDDFEKLASAQHCVYRQPDGKWYQVAIKSVDFSKGNLFWTVSISQEAETR